MNITRSNAVKLFVALNFKTADAWSDERLNQKLAVIERNVDGTEEMEADIGKIFKEVLAAREKGDTVTVESKPSEEKPKKDKPAKPEPAKEKEEAKESESDEDEEEEKPKKEKAPVKKDTAKKPTAAKAAPAKAPAKKPAAAKAKESEDNLPKDAFGNREGTDLAKINAVLIKAKGKPKDLAALTKESGVRRGRCRRQMKKLVAKKLVKETKEGFLMSA
jgi:outer membrane biosynthesis protein TonB